MNVPHIRSFHPSPLSEEGTPPIPNVHIPSLYHAEPIGAGRARAALAVRWMLGGR